MRNRFSRLPLKQQKPVGKKSMLASVCLLLLALAIPIMACAGIGDTSTPNQQNQDQTNNGNAATRLHQENPYPQLTHSNELQNQVTRYQRLNNPNEVGYIYVISYNLIFGPYQVIGKCSSTESLYSSPTTVINPNDITNSDFSSNQQAVSIPAAQPDGSYGQNENAIFCFLDDANKTMVEFNSQWIWTEKPLLGLPTVPGSAVVQNGK